MQLKFITKEEAHKLIEEIPGEKVLILTYNCSIGISDCGKYIKKKKSKKIVDKAKSIVLAKNKPVTTLNLHDRLFNDFGEYNREGIVRTIMLPKLE